MPVRSPYFCSIVRSFSTLMSIIHISFLASKKCNSSTNFAIGEVLEQHRSDLVKGKGIQITTRYIYFLTPII